MEKQYTGGYGASQRSEDSLTNNTGGSQKQVRILFLIESEISGVTDRERMIRKSYRYDDFGNIIFGKPQYNNVYSYNAERYNLNVDTQYLRARYYCSTTADFLTEDSYLGNITDPLTLNRYSYVKISPLNYVDPSGHDEITLIDVIKQYGLHHDQFGLDIGAWYLYGNGSPFVVKNESGNQPDTWRDYMESNKILTGKVGDVVITIGENLSNDSSLQIDMSLCMLRMEM